VDAWFGCQYAQISSSAFSKALPGGPPDLFRGLIQAGDQKRLCQIQPAAKIYINTAGFTVGIDNKT